MNKYFDNPELKKSSLIIVGIAFITIIISFFVIEKSYEGIKRSYIESNMALVGEISKSHPKLKREIIETIVKGPNEESIEKGRSILKEYGFDENLEIEFIPSMEYNYHKVLKTILVFLLVFFVVVFIQNYFQYIKIYKRLERLRLAAQNIVDQNFNIGIYENAEGIFAKLAYVFNNMRIVMKNNFLSIEKEKEFLINLLSDISHQLKTPISSLIIYNDILLNRTIDDDKRREFLENSSKQLNRIEWLVKSLLKLAKLDAGAIRFEKINGDINKTVEESIEVLRAKAKYEKVDLRFYSEDFKILMEHDPNWLSEAIINLVKNSLEHTKKGGVVEVNTERTSVLTKITVKDTGEGIPKEELPHIFKRFYKGRRNKNVESVGIGLALSKSIIEAHDGMINVESKEGEGTLFTITFLRN
ncbi:HAMP domain-containing sensor histidine kinase [Clostridium sporogenes]|uniref:sensor histidine kinase n=1 Tax=Clostridium TaxID=1485 RepID=UPI000BBC60C1|nr:HAMP domain-containing sensor histidine kinase [Clostridium cochlearium]MBE6064923.1 HAMP domain-containing histidine kinase [Clostridium cochlearium]MDU1443367.1 HAMP domain-containing sensor histidine kinase [Clostridium cochlearium]NMA58944.1 HAMP domain-containing histidine kinase [Clostridium cochlearium]